MLQTMRQVIRIMLQTMLQTMLQIQMMFRVIQMIRVMLENDMLKREGKYTPFGYPVQC